MAESKLSPLQWWTEELFLEEEYRDTAAVVSSAGHHRRLSLSPRVVKEKGYLDEQFCQVEDLQDEASPNFVEEVVTLFFKDSGRLMSNIEQALIGASRMKNECMSFRDSCGQGNVEGCMRSFQKVKREHAILRQKLESYFQLLRQAGPAGAATRPVM
uniref:Histidine-containing phosphotransfer protein n=1 Tax=Leersia perrieri TaxID=77586 RepID=A0A0D9V5I9_9ORYZ